MTEYRNKASSGYVNKSVDKALSILEFFNSQTDKLSITQIADKLDTNPSSLYPILHTLEEYDYLHRSKDKQYSLGMTFVKKGRCVLERLNLSSEARSEIEALRDETQKTVHLGYINENRIVYVDKVESRGVKLYSSPGKTAPLHATALGKVIMAHISSDQLDELLDNLELTSHTKNTITSRRKLRQELQDIRDRGYAIDDEEFEEGIRCVASPIYRHDGEVNAAISLTGLAAQMSEEGLKEKSSLVKRHAANISRKLGYHSEPN
ncbi:MAG: IclR family transcriptional regulator [Candidatus Bipolaricaulota bacterium]|nr:IclR family transcriptional regulator [Candidatus Bipolaricaulota bacterium]